MPRMCGKTVDTLRLEQRCSVPWQSPVLVSEKPGRDYYYSRVGNDEVNGERGKPHGLLTVLCLPSLETSMMAAFSQSERMPECPLQSVFIHPNVTTTFASYSRHLLYLHRST